MIINIIECNGIGFSARVYSNQENMEKLYPEVMTAYYPTAEMALRAAQNKLALAN